MADRRLLWALHESGHAAIATLVLAWPVRRVTIVPRPDPTSREGYAYGTCEILMRVAGDADPRAVASQRCLFAVAGHLAVAHDARLGPRVVAGLAHPGWDSDPRLIEFLEARAVLAPHCDDPDGALARVGADAVAFLREPATWRAVLALANELVHAGELEGWRATEILVTAAGCSPEEEGRYLDHYRAQAARVA